MSAVGELEAEGVFGVVGHFPAQQGDEVEAGRAVGLRRHLGRGWSILMPLAPPRSRALAAAQRHCVASNSCLFFLTEVSMQYTMVALKWRWLSVATQVSHPDPCFVSLQSAQVEGV